jgi:3-(3-hydroxy-phenyl)propionate hydroxylase
MEQNNAPDRGSPVVIVGAGPVGQSAALLLARWGVETVVLDDHPERAEIGSKALCQQRDVLDIWESVGAGARIAAEGTSWTTARTFHRDAELFATSYADRSRSPFPPFLNISQARVEQILDEAIRASELIEVRWDHQVTALRQHPGGVSLEIEGHAPVTGSFALVCAGAGCGDLRRDAGVSFDGRSFDDRFLICDVRADRHAWAHERRFYFDPPWNPERQILIHACPDSTFRVDWHMPPDFDLAAEQRSGALDARMHAIFGRQDIELLWASVYRFHSRCVDRMRVGRVLFAGDAAHLVSPFGARGLNSGVADAENAAWKLAYLLNGWGGPELLESYHVERHAAAQENLQVVTETMNFLVPPSEEFRSLRRDILDHAHHDPAAHAEINSGRLAEPFWYSDSPLSTPSPDHPATGRPPRGVAPPPAPGVLIPDVPVRTPTGDTRTLRSSARHGLLLLLTDGGDITERDVAGCGPVRVEPLDELDVDGELAAALSARPGELWIVRPDAHIAAVLPACSAETARAAVRRAVGHPDLPGPAGSGHLERAPARSG